MLTKNKPVNPSLLWSPVHFLSLGFGSGLSPIAPGTAGTLVAVGLYYLLTGLSLQGYLMVTLLAGVVGIYVCGRTGKALQVSDHPAIVWDEIVGYLITMAFVPLAWSWMVAGFILFRVFDILKPWPIGMLDRQVKGGLGVMLDDVVAGIMAAGCLALLGVTDLFPV